jgi:hypothetical protein
VNEVPTRVFLIILISIEARKLKLHYTLQVLHTMLVSSEGNAARNKIKIFALRAENFISRFRHKKRFKSFNFSPLLSTVLPRNFIHVEVDFHAFRSRKLLIKFM